MNTFLLVISVACLAYTSGAPNNKFRAAEDVLGFASCDGGIRGGNIGGLWTVTTPSQLKEAITGNEPRYIQVVGRIDLTELYTKSPGVVLDIGSFKTIEGRNGAEITGGGLRIKNKQQIIIRNIKFTNPISYAPGELPDGNGGIINQQPGEYTEVDSVLLENGTYVWIDHNEFSDDPWVSDEVPNDRMRHDGLVDIKRGSDYVTVSNNIFRNHNKNILVGHSDANGDQDSAMRITFVGNWFRGTKQRNPRVRFARVHVLNNLYTDIGTYGIGAGAGARIYAEGNVFVNSRAYRHPDGVPTPMGCLEPHDTLIVSGTSNVEELACTSVSWRPSQFYSYQPLSSNVVQQTVMANAGTL